MSDDQIQNGNLKVYVREASALCYCVGNTCIYTVWLLYISISSCTCDSIALPGPGTGDGRERERGIVLPSPIGNSHAVLCHFIVL